MNCLNYKSNISSMEDCQLKEFFRMVLFTGIVMLENGAETYRVEDTLKRICKSRIDTDSIHVFVIPSSIFLSVDYKGEFYSQLQRTESSSMNLNNIHMANKFSREFVNSDMSVEEGMRRIEEISNFRLYTGRQRIISAAMVSACFTGLFNSGFSTIVASFFVSIMSMTIMDHIYQYRFISFIENLMTGFLIAFFASIAKSIGMANTIDAIVIGTIMPILPGYALTNALRDAISGDHISSLSRGLDAILSGLAIALGVAIVLKIF